MRFARTVALCLLAGGLTNCGEGPGPPDHPSTTEESPEAEPPIEPVVAAPRTTMDAVPETGRVEFEALRLPSPGTPLASVDAAAPSCRQQLEDGLVSCTTHGWIAPLSRPCRDGCTWWRYFFDGERLDAAELERSVADVDETWAAGFTREAHWIADALTRQLGAAPTVDARTGWATVEQREHGPELVLERRTWETEAALVTWSLIGTPGHHPVVSLRVRTEALRPEHLRFEPVDSSLQPGSTVARARGGRLERPLDVPLWLEFYERDRDDRCGLHHEVDGFLLPDGRLYVWQNNTLCGRGGSCRLLDPRSGRVDIPPGGCIEGEGIHQRTTAIDDEHVLLVSDAEGGGEVSVVRYSPTEGTERVLRLSLSSMAPLRAEVNDAGVDFSTVCELPPGCLYREYGERPTQRYRWTASAGLRRVDAEP